MFNQINLRSTRDFFSIKYISELLENVIIKPISDLLE